MISNKRQETIWNPLWSDEVGENICRNSLELSKLGGDWLFTAPVTIRKVFFNVCSYLLFDFLKIYWFWQKLQKILSILNIFWRVFEIQKLLYISLDTWFKEIESEFNFLRIKKCLCFFQIEIFDIFHCQPLIIFTSGQNIVCQECCVGGGIKFLSCPVLFYKKKVKKIVRR